MSAAAGDPRAAHRRLASGELVLELRDACVETTARRAHRALVARALDGATAAMAAPLALLTRFLEQTDFRRLRARHPELAGDEACDVRLFRGEDGAVRWEICRSPR